MAGTRNPWEENYGSSDGQDTGGKPWEQAYQQPEAPKSRTLGAVANDTVIEVANAAAGGVSSAANFIKPGNAVSGWIDKNIVKAGEDSQSDVTKAAKQQFRDEVENADGVMGELGAVGKYVVQNPLLSAAQAAGSFVGPGLAVKAAGFAGKAAQLGAKGVERAGRAGGVAAGAAMAGGDAAGTAYERSKNAGATEDQAVDAGRQASVIPAIVGGVSGMFGAERLLAGAKGFSGGAASRALKTGASEAAQEGLEEGVTQYEGQRAAMPYDASIDPSKGVAAAAGMGAALGGITGAGTSLLAGHGPQPGEQEPAPAPGQPPEPPAPTQGTGPALALPAPDRGVIQVSGDGTARTPAYQTPGYVGDVTDVEPRPIDPVREQVAAAAEQGGALSGAALTAIDTGVTQAMQPVVPEAALPAPISLEEADARDQAAYEQHWDSYDSDPVVSRYFEDDSDIPDFGAASNVSDEEFLRSLGATDEDIQDAIATARQSPIPQSSPAVNAGAQANEPAGPREGAGGNQAAQGQGQVTLRQPENFTGTPIATMGKQGATARPGPAFGLKDALAQIRAKKQQEAANAQAATPEAAPASAPVPAAGTGAVEAAGVAAPNIKAITAKQIPDMTDGELQMAIQHYGPEHKRTAKLQKEVQRRAAQATQGSTNATQTDQAQQASAPPAQAAAAPAAEPATSTGAPATAGASTVRALNDGAPTADTGAQAAPAPSAQVAAPAESKEQRAQRVAAAGEAWTRMPSVERQALADRAEGLNPIQRKNVAKTAWADLAGAIQRKLADAMGARAETGVNSTSASTESAPAAINSVADSGEKARWLKSVADMNRISGQFGAQIDGLVNGRLNVVGSPSATKQGRALMAAVDEARRAGATNEEIAQAAKGRATSAPAAAAPQPEPKGPPAMALQETTHNGTRLYQTRIKVGNDDLKTMWAVESPENKARRQAGERMIGGDSLHDTLELAKAAADRESKQDAERKAYQAEQEAKDRAEREAVEAKKEANRGKSIVERRKDALLDGQHKYPASAGLGTGTRREAMQMAVEQDRAIVERQVDDTAAKKRDNEAIDRVRRAGYMLGLSNENIPVVKAGLEAQARLKANDYKKPEYRVYSGNDASGSFWEITKTEYEYAQGLLEKKAAEPAPAAVSAPKVRADEMLPDGWDKTINGYTKRPVYRFTQDTGKPFAVVTQVDGMKYEVQIRHGDKQLTIADRAGELSEVLAYGKTELDRMTAADSVTHQDPGEKAEAATKSVVTDSLKKAASNEDTKPSEMRKWLVAEIDKELLQASDRPDYDEAVKRLGEKDAISMFTGSGPLGKNSETGFITFDVPGDGKYKVRNSVRGLLEFRKNVLASPGFKDGGQRQNTQQPEQTDSARNGSGSTVEAIRNFLADGDVQGAVEFAKLKGVEFTPVEPRASMTANGKFKRVPASVKSSVPSVADGLTQVEAEQINQYLTAEQARAEPADAQDADVQPSPQDFIPAPDGGLDYGEITPEMGKAMRRQAGKIRLQHGVQNSNGTGWGLVHIEANHGKQISGLGFGSVQDFVAHVASSIQQVWQVPGNSQLLLTLKDGRKDVMYIQLEIAKEGDFYRVNSAFPVRQEDYESLKGMKKIWDGSEPTSAVTGQRPAFATAANASPESESSQGSSNARGQDDSVSPTAPAAQPEAPKLTPTEAKSLMAWEDLGQKDGVKTHALTFYESQADKDAKRGRMIVAKVSKGDRSANNWMVEGDDKPLAVLGMAKKRAEEIGMAKAVADGFVEPAAAKPAAAKPAAAPQPAAPAAPIEDAGEKIGGARKDRWKERGLNLDDLDAMTEAEGAELATKANVWKPDYEALAAQSEPVTAAMVKTIYDQLAAKPKQNTPEGRRQYVQMMRIVRDVYTEAKGPEAVRNAYLEIRKRAGLNAADPAAKATGRELLFSVYKGRSDPFVLGYTEMSKAKKLVEDGFPAKGEPWKTRLSVGRAEGGPGTTERGIEIYVERSAEVGTPLTREQILGGFYRVTTKDNKTVAFAPTKVDAEAAAATVYERDMKGKKDGKPEPVRPNLDELKRENLPQRIDRDVTSEDFVRDLGFRGVEFGNWSAQDERQRILNMAYDGLMDLAEIMGVPPKAMSLNGTLGMAFGARGGGRFAAHYEPGKLVINMTKIRGGGSMAHEWAHAMDHYFGELDKADAYTTQARGASGWYSEDQYNGVPRKRMERVGNEWKNVEKMRLDNLRPEMAAAFDEVMRALFQKQITKAEMVRSHELDLERTQALARNEQDAELKAMYQNMVQNKRQALNELRKDPDDKMYAGRGRTDYANQAQALSGKSVDGYWVRPTEMFARAFESWVFDRVTAMGARSDYLVHGVEEDRFAGGGYKGNPYPTGEERARINAAFDKLAGTIQTKQTDTGVAMFSRASGSVPQTVAEWLPDTVIADEVEKRIGGFAQQPPIRIRDTAFGQLPGVARNDNVAGAVHDGAIYLFRDQLGDRAAVQRTLFHELFHFGLRKFLTKEQFTGQMMNLYRRDRAIKEEADRWAATADGLRAKEFGGSEYALARGVDEALAILAEPNGGPHLNQTARAMFVRRVTNWLADVAQFLKMDKAAAYLRSLHNSEARAYIQSVFKRLETDAGGNTLNWSETSEPAFSRTASPSQPAAWDAPTPTGFDDVIYKLQDKNIDLKRVVESITKATGKVADSINAYLKEELFHKRAAKRVADFGARELKPLMNQMRLAGLSMEDVEEYLHARHAKEANAVIAQRNPGNAGLQDGGSGMTNAAADNYFAKLDPAQRRKLESVAAKVDAIIADTRKLYVDYGLEDQAVVDGWANMYQHYIPLMREDKDGGMGTGQGFSVKGRETKGRTGSTRKVVDILANIASQREKLIVRGEKNRVTQALVGLAQANPNSEFWEVRSQAPTERVFDPKTGVVVERPDPLFKSRDNVVVAKVKDAKGNVTEQMVVFNEDNPRAVRMAAAMKNLDAGNLEGLLGVSAKITRYFAAINTQYNPVFGVVNLVRDVQGAMVNLAATPLAGQQGKIAKDTVSALRGIYGDIRKTRRGGQATSQWSQLWEQMQDDGGTTGYRELFTTSADRANNLKSILNPESWMDNKWGKFFTANGTLRVPMSMAQKGATEIFGWLSDYNEAMENGVRLAAYKAALDKGMSREQAASIAKNLTVNFNRKGQVGQQAGAVYAFFNAAMQGTARIGQTLFDMDGGDISTLRLSKTGKAVVYGGVTLGAIQALALAAAGFDAEDPPEFVRERSLIIPTGGKTYVTIPMPLGLHVIPGIGRHAVEFALSGFDKPAQRAVSVAGMFADAFNPIGNAGLSMQTIAPTALDPIAALTENKDWTGKPIARTSFNKAEPGHTQWKDTATGFSKVVAEAINWVSGGNEYVAGALSPTPDQIDYLLAQLGGGVARELAKVQQTVTTAASGEELPTYKVPLVGRFVGNAASQASQGSAFYANLNRLNELETEIKGLRKDGRFDEAAKLARENPESMMIAMANRAERDVQKLRREKRELIAKDASREEVRAKEEQITAVMTRLNEAAERRKALATQ